MKIGMLGVVNNLSTRLNSHNAGWTLVCRNILERKFHDVVEVLDNRCEYEEYGQEFLQDNLTSDH
jgi:hypothetical protein